MNCSDGVAHDVVAVEDPRLSRNDGHPEWRRAQGTSRKMMESESGDSVFHRGDN